MSVSSSLGREVVVAVALSHSVAVLELVKKIRMPCRDVGATCAVILTSRDLCARFKMRGDSLYPSQAVFVEGEGQGKTIDV